jgi:DHA1 family bicyclomycin/chloramphenicol resistance-like MFS transporter
MGIAAANALSYGAIFVYIAGSPVVVMAQMGHSAEVFAAVFATTAAALATGAWTSGRLSRRGIRAAALVGPSLLFAVLATLALAIVSLTGFTSGAIALPLLVVVLYTRGIIAPNLQQLAIERQRDRAGVASAAVGVSQLLSGALASGVVAFLLQWYGPSAVAVPMALLAAAALMTWRWAC